MDKIGDFKDELGYPERVEYTLDQLLPLVNCKRKPRESL